MAEPNSKSPEAAALAEGGQISKSQAAAAAAATPNSRSHQAMVMEGVLNSKSLTVAVVVDSRKLESAAVAVAHQWTWTVPIKMGDLAAMKLGGRRLHVA